LGKSKAELNVAINQAAESARKAGKLPGSLESILDEIKEPKVCWKQVLARFLRSNNTDDFSWQKPNRRFIGQGLYLPSMYNPSVDEIAVVSDTSGSRTDTELNQDLAEISSILRDLSPEAIHLIQCDTEVNSDISYTRESLPLKTIEFNGRGGTRFAPAIEYVNKHHPNVASLIYLTDLECDDFGDAPHYPVLWITTEPGGAPYGEIIEM
jgi:predicted metal-dependent peptidase